MRNGLVCGAAALLLAACASGGDTGGRGPEVPPPPPAAGQDPAARPPDPAAERAERLANEAAYREQYLPVRTRLKADHLGKWIVIARGVMLPANERRTFPAPAATMEEADLAARAEAPAARHRFVFRIGEEGDEKEFLGGTEVRHVLGVAFLAAWEGRGTLGPNVSLLLDRVGQVSQRAADGRPFVRAAVLPPSGVGGAEEEWGLSTGFNGYAVLSPATAERVGLALWEIPGSVRIEGVLQSGDCRRARARLRIPPGGGVDLEFPVAIWPDGR